MRHGVYEILLRCGVSYCTRCGRVLPIDAFNRDTGKRHGISYHCYPCKNGYRTGVFPAVLPIAREYEPWHHRIVYDLQWVLDRNGMAYCAKGDHILPWEQFSPDAKNSNGLACNCLACHSEYGNGRTDKGLRTPEQRKRIGAGRRDGARRARDGEVVWPK